MSQASQKRKSKIETRTPARKGLAFSIFLTSKGGYRPFRHPAPGFCMVRSVVDPSGSDRLRGT